MGPGRGSDHARPWLFLVAPLACGCFDFEGFHLKSDGPRPAHGEIVQPMASIPSGTFSMGTSDASYDHEEARPAHLVSVAAFQMDETEVTVAEYRACTDAGYCRVATVSNSSDVPGAQCSAALADHDAYPIDCVTRFDAERYCAWVGMRLPTEEEWEYAAQRPGGRVFPWGNDPTSPLRLNACGSECSQTGFQWTDGFRDTAPVGSFPDGQSVDGLLDLAGNVWEWTASLGCAYPAVACNACAPGTPGCMTPCPTCDDGAPTIARGGGSSSDNDHYLRVYERGHFDPYNQWPGIGFRCAR